MTPTTYLQMILSHLRLSAWLRTNDRPHSPTSEWTWALSLLTSTSIARTTIWAEHQTRHSSGARRLQVVRGKATILALTCWLKSKALMVACLALLWMSRSSLDLPCQKRNRLQKIRNSRSEKLKFFLRHSQMTDWSLSTQTVRTAIIQSSTNPKSSSNWFQLGSSWLGSVVICTSSLTLGMPSAEKNLAFNAVRDQNLTNTAKFW